MCYDMGMQVSDQGSIVVFIPEGDYEYEWLMLSTNAEPWQWQGRSLCVGHRYASDLLLGVIDAGFATEAA